MVRLKKKKLKKKNMNIDLVFSNSAEDKRLTRPFFLSVVKTALEVLKIKDEIELSINLVGEREIKNLNKKYRGKDQATDVLSFPLEEDKNYGILPLGDIFICSAFALRASTSTEVSADKSVFAENKREIARLVIHGLLHLLGYDHEKSENDEEKMSKLENNILNKWLDHI